MKVPAFLIARGITQIATLDFETFYSKSYTLRKMSTSLYIFDDQFLAHGLGIKLTSDGVTNYYYNDESIQKALDKIDWSITAILCHHTHFDGLILKYHYGIKPAYYLDTLSMARPILQNKLKKLDLDSIAKYYGVQGKLEGLEDTKNKRELTITEAVRLGIYCKNDCDITDPIFEKLIPNFPVLEMDIINLTIKMYADPKLIVDEWLIDLEIKSIRKHKKEMFAKVKSLLPKKLKEMDVIKVLRSSNMLSETLRHHGIIVPTKISPTTGLKVSAFAKTDLEFQALTTHIDPNAKLLHDARLVSKSDTALNKAVLLKKFAQAKCCPIYLNYWKAQTGRFSGGDKWNPQNLPRGGAARLSLLAPEDHVLLVSDLSQVELRMSAWFAGQQDILDVFARGDDVYKDMATKIYNIDIEEVIKNQRTVGKVTCLGLGYGAWTDTFDKMLKAGAMGPKVDLPRTEVQHIVDVYRSTNNKIVQGWKKAGKWLLAMCNNTGIHEPDYKGLSFHVGRVDMPNGTSLLYPDMVLNDDGKTITYTGANGQLRYIYSSLFYENIIQSLARHVIAEQMVEVAKTYDVVLSVHDELIVSVPFIEINEATKLVESIMRTSPEWCDDLILDCESGYAIEYSK